MNITNTPEMIESIIKDKNFEELIIDQESRFWNSVRIGFKSIFYGKKWAIYLILNVFILLISVIFFGGESEDVKTDYIDYVYENYFPFLFVFGCFLISLPLAADEISDNVVDQYLISPMKRETYWFSRWVVMNITVFFVNVGISFMYYLLICAHYKDGFVNGFNSGLSAFLEMVILLIPATLIYAGLFLFISSLGTRGFTWAFFMAIFEPLFLSLLFLYGNPYIPQTNVLRIADGLFSNSLDGNRYNFDVSILHAISYTIGFSISILVLGGLYLRNREFK